MAHRWEIEDGKLDTACVKAFRVPAGTLVEVFNTTLPYTPSMVDDGGFQVMVALPAGTNGPRPEAAADMPAAGDSYCYWKADKWVLCHADSPKAAEGGYVGLVGKTLGITALSVFGALLLGVGMSLCMVFGYMVQGIVLGLLGILALLCLIPLTKGLK